MANGLVEQFIFGIKHYNEVLNVSRSYLTPSHSPSLTDMALQIYDQLDWSVLKANRHWLSPRFRQLHDLGLRIPIWIPSQVSRATVLKVWTSLPRQR
jgi:neutral trehalase